MSAEVGNESSEPRRDFSSGGEPARALKNNPERLSIARVIAGAVGVVYILIGLIGFAVTGFDGIVANQDEAILTLFAVNPFHNVVHLVVGVGLLGVSLVREAALAEGALIGGGLVYLLAAVLGFFNQLPILAIDTPLAPDNFLHLASGAAALLFGMAGALQARRLREA